jgi:sulfatase maturation enzyme AslB (radical SAM superfamily)
MKINKIDKEIKNLCIFVWNTCNLSCDYCYLEPIINSKEAYKKKTEVSIDTLCNWLDIFFGFDDFKKKKIVFTWWESMLYLSIINNTLNYITNRDLNKKRNISISINTNWLFFDENIKKLLNSIIQKDIFLSLNISLDWDLDASSWRFTSFWKDVHGNMYEKIVNNIKQIKGIFWKKVNINISTTFTSKTYWKLLENYLFLIKSWIKDEINWLSLRPALWDWWWTEWKVKIVRKIFITIKKIQKSFTFASKSIIRFENKVWIECILSEIVLAPDWNFYKCEALIWDTNTLIWNVKDWIFQKFLLCEFNPDSDICKYEECVWCGTYCQNDMHILWTIKENKKYLQEVMEVVSSFYNSMK